MKMLLIVFRESLEEEIVALLNELNIKAFTELHKVSGTGETGDAFHSFAGSGVNSMILAALPEDQSERLVEKLKDFREERAREYHGVKIPLRVFVLPCEQLV